MGENRSPGAVGDALNAAELVAAWNAVGLVNVSSTAHLRDGGREHREAVHRIRPAASQHAERVPSADCGCYRCRGARRILSASSPNASAHLVSVVLPVGDPVRVAEPVPRVTRTATALRLVDPRFPNVCGSRLRRRREARRLVASVRDNLVLGRDPARLPPVSTSARRARAPAPLQSCTASSLSKYQTTQRGPCHSRPRSSALDLI